MKLHFIENVTALAIDNYLQHKTRFFAVTNGRPSEIISDDEFEIFKDYNNSLLYKEYVPYIIFIKNNDDIYIYSNYDINVDDSINCETIVDVLFNNTAYNSTEDVIRSIPTEEMPEETKLDYYKFRRIYDHENNNFYGSLSTYSTLFGNCFIEILIICIFSFIKTSKLVLKFWY